MFLEIKNIRKHYGEGESRVEVLKGIDIEIEKGEICVLLGPSGSGKSTLLNIIGGIDYADDGYIAINGDKIEDMNEKQLTRYRRKHLGYVFQMYNLIPNLNIKENVETGAYLSDNPMNTDEILKGLGLYEHRHKLPNQLSGGQQQRTSIGRAIIKNPDFIIVFKLFYRFVRHFVCRHEICIFHIIFVKSLFICIIYAVVRHQKTGHKTNKHSHEQKDNKILAYISF